MPRMPGVPQDNGYTAGGLNPVAVVCHRTYGGWSGDYSVGKGARGKIGFHFLVGKNEGQWVQFGDTSRLMYHAKGANAWSIGIEVTGVNEDVFTDWQTRACRAIVEWISATHGIPKSYVDSGRTGRRAGFIAHNAVAGSTHTDRWGDNWTRVMGGNVPAPPPAVDDYWNGVFQQGSRGPGVAHVQANLAKFGYSVGAADGIFGPKTSGALRAFQTDAGITVDGIFGPQSRTAMEDRYYGRGKWKQVSAPPSPPADVPAFPGFVRRGSRGPAVTAVQSRLRARGWNISVDGQFGPQTEHTVKAFQREKGLSVDGIAGPRTWEALWTAPIT